MVVQWSAHVELTVWTHGLLGGILMGLCSLSALLVMVLSVPVVMGNGVITSGQGVCMTCVIIIILKINLWLSQEVSYSLP